jgi:hypothetical protein
MRPAFRLLSYVAAASLMLAQTASAFCGFYVATGDTPLTNKASRVVLAYDGTATRVSMASDMHGDPEQFGLVIPVPTVIKKEQVKILNPSLMQHLADYTKPRLVQYFDSDPCAPPVVYAPMTALPSPAGMSLRGVMPAPKSTVRIEEQYSVGEYDIVVITATKPADLVAFLNANGYKVPQAATETVGSYLRQGMHFFLAKVNMARMKEENATGFLRPIQVTYQSPKFMLPIRLGMVNAAGPQDMIVMALTKRGRVETVNYPTVKVPTGENIPMYVESRFGQFYDAMFERQVERNGASTFLEYAWNLGSCDPCSAPPMDSAELKALGANWVQENTWQQQAFVTRLHVRYDNAHFPEDLVLQETPDQQPFQARYVMQHPFNGPATCPAGEAYRKSLPERFAAEAETLAALTGWSQDAIRTEMRATGEMVP